MIKLHAQGLTLSWHVGSHTVNVFRDATEVDVFTFGWEHDRTTVQMFTRAADSWLAELT